MIGGLCLSAGLSAAWLWRGTPARAALAFYVGAQLAYVGVFQDRRLPSLWYLAPALLLTVLVVARLLARVRGHRGQALVLCGLVLWAIGAALVWKHRLDPRSYSSYAGARRDGLWLSEHLREGEWAAGWDIGIVGAYSGGRAVNLEGLVAGPYYDPGEAVGFLMRHPKIRYLAQYVRHDHLCRFRPLYFGGIRLEESNLVRSESVEFRSLSWRMTGTIHRLIFDLHDEPSTALDQLRNRACNAPVVPRPAAL